MKEPEELFEPKDIEGGDDADAGDSDPTPAAGNDSSAMLAEATAEAAELGIIVPDDAEDAEEWVKHFVTAVKTHKSTKSLNEPAAPMGADDGIDDLDTAPKEEPQAVSMSTAVQGRIDRLEGFASDQVCGRMNQVVDDLVGAGRVSPANGHAWKEILGRKRLSLLPGKHDHEVAAVLSKLEMAKEIPEGTFWTAEIKTARLSRRGSQEPVPDHVSFVKDGVELSGDAVQKVIDEQFGNKK